METSYSTRLTELYKEDGRKISYERWVKNLGKRIFLELKELLGIDLELPNKFYTIHGDQRGTVIKEKDYNSNIVVAQFAFKVKKNDRMTRVVKIRKTKIGFTVRYDMTLKTFIENVGHEMVHYYDLVHNKKYPLHHRRAFNRIKRQWNKKLKNYGLEIDRECHLLNRIDANDLSRTKTS